MPIRPVSQLYGVNVTRNDVRSRSATPCANCWADDAVASSPEELAANFKREIARYAKIIKAGNIRLD